MRYRIVSARGGRGKKHNRQSGGWQPGGRDVRTSGGGAESGREKKKAKVRSSFATSNGNWLKKKKKV